MGAADFIQDGESWLEQSQGLTDIFSFPSPPSYHPWRTSAVISSPYYCILIEFPFPPALLWKLKNFLPPLSRIIHFSLALASTNSIHFTSIWFLLHLTETIPFLFPSFSFENSCEYKQQQQKFCFMIIRTSLCIFVSQVKCYNKEKFLSDFAYTPGTSNQKTGVIIKAKQSLSFLEVSDHWIWESVGGQENSQ